MPQNFRTVSVAFRGCNVESVFEDFDSAIEFFQKHYNVTEVKKSDHAVEITIGDSESGWKIRVYNWPVYSKYAR